MRHYETFKDNKGGEFMKLLTPKEAAGYMKMSTNTLAAWRSQKRGPAFIRTGRVIKYDQAALDSYLKRNIVDTTSI